MGGGDKAGVRLALAAQVHHLAGVGRHQGEERCAERHAPAMQEQHRTQRQYQREQHRRDDQPKVGRHLLHHRQGEMTADGNRHDELPGLAAMGNFRHQATGATGQHHGDQRTDHPGQRPPRPTGKAAAQRADNQCEKPMVGHGRVLGMEKNADRL